MCAYGVIPRLAMWLGPGFGGSGSCRIFIAYGVLESEGFCNLVP